MKESISRVRLFAGPNGSGKSTIKSVINPKLLGIYINPDEIEKEIRERGFFDFQRYQIKASSKKVLDFLANSSLLKIANLSEQAQRLDFSENRLVFNEVQVNSYFAAVIADFIREELLECKKTFTFESVMSSPDKIEFLRKAQSSNYRTYLYYVATEDPEINISRVENRVKMGGHPVPKEKIVSRYYRSLDLLMDAVKSTHRSYIFDNSGHTHIWLAEILNGQTITMQTDNIPLWFHKFLLDKFTQSK